MSDASTDRVVKQYRSQISDADLAILTAVNKRISLVARLHAYKRERGYDVLDPAREDWMLSFLKRANTGPISEEQLTELYQHLLDLSKAEARRLGEEETATA